MGRMSTDISGYMIYPYYLLKMKLSDSAKLVYILLLNRLRMSERREEYTDENGRSFVFYTMAALAKDICRSRSTVRDALSALEAEGLIEKRSQGRGYANIIYVNIPEEKEKGPGEKPAPSGAKNFTHEVQKTEGDCIEKPAQGVSENRQGEVRISGTGCGGKLTPSKIYNNKNNNKKRVSKRERERASPRGYYKNVFLSDEEYRSLTDSYDAAGEYIERLSSYIRIHGKDYVCHDAVIRRWLEEDGHKKQEPDYYDDWEDLSL